MADSREDGEVRKTSQALRRWATQGQAELWQGELSKTIRVADRLEHLMSLEDSVREIMEDRAASIRKLDFASALANFYYGPYPAFDRALLRQRLASYVGTHTIWARSHDNESRDLLYYESDTHFRLELHDELPVLTVQEFDLVEDRAQARRSGFQFVGETGTLIRYLISSEDPRIRWVEILHETKLDPGHPIPSAAKRYFVTVSTLDLVSSDGSALHRSTISTGWVKNYSNDDILVNTARMEVKRRSDAQFSSIMWEVPL